ncbi:thymidylate synthase [Candidatus Woesearchaeota archaeon]|nr:thymidylate synthase [Candidatus Woesearchaeota archaeon]|tara:strand:- start:2917 stop:4569 length:1653 start_codon:yes stop_codon:yes gene_type:complete
MTDSFTEEEKKILAPYFTNLDKPVYAFTNRVPEEVVAVLFSKYSRSISSVRKNFLRLVKDPNAGFQEILDTVGSGEGKGFTAALEKARNFFQRILVGYGDDSIGELGMAHIACEDISNIATKRLESARLTSPLEKSTRYVIYDKTKFLREPKIMRSEFADEYVRVNELLLNTYAEQIEPMIAYVKKQWPIEDADLFQGKKYSEISDEAELKRAEKAYESSVKAKALDILRYYMPASTLTNMGITANGRAFEYLISKLMSDELEEVRSIGRMMKEELSKVIPSLVKRAKPSDFVIETRKGMQQLTNKMFENETSETGETVALIDYDKDAEVKIVSSALYEFSNLPMAQIREKVNAMATEERLKVLEEYIGKRTNRREKPMRAAEAAYYTFDMLSDYGAYRDLQRHRMLTQIPQALTVAHGYDIPPELAEVGFEDKFHECMKAAEELYHKLHAKYPHEAQYVVPFAYKIRYLFVFNLREAFHLIELRSVPQGHPSYRYVAQEMFRQIKNVHPVFAQYMRYVYLDERDSLGRLKGELKTQEKLAKLGGKEIDL